MKRLLNKFSVIIVVLACICCMACGDDDENGSDNRLVGVWVKTYKQAYMTMYCGIKFHSNGTCRYDEWNSNTSPKFEPTSATWRTEGNTLYVNMPNGHKYGLTYFISEDGKKLTLVNNGVDDDGGFADTYTKDENL